MNAAQPLLGKHILITRPQAQSDALAQQLADLGAEPVLLPAIEIVLPVQNKELDRAVAEIPTYQWVIFTSANGVQAVWIRMEALGLEISSFKGVKVAAIGPATAHALEDLGIVPDFIPDEYLAEAIAAEIGDVRGQRILLPRAAIARKALPELLRQKEALVTEIAAYQTRQAALTPQQAANLLQGIDAVTFTSPSTVAGFTQMLNGNHFNLLGNAVIACIGPVTAQAAREIGYEPQIIASEHTTSGLVKALVEYYQNARTSREFK
ncbi:MAG: uroporphyrinogen-III synthase [Chloroflexi bacterium]|nr:uroporphyrinogen-III synthase [Chloroflexota bacterium]